MDARGKHADRQWLEISVYHPPEVAEAVAAYLFECGASALSLEEDSQDPAQWVSTAGFKAHPGQDHPATDLPAFLVTLADIFDLPEPPRWLRRQVPQGDWAEKWKEGLSPIEIGPSLVVKPTWCEYTPRPGQKIIELDPGLAFGTGRHATTYMCLEALERFCRPSDRTGLRILDLGTGSGILALAAAALGQTHIIAVDVDPEAIRVAAENVALAGAGSSITLACSGSEALTGHFDLILANLTAADLKQVSPDLARLSAPGATLILSGILDDQAEDLARHYAGSGFEILERLSGDEWRTFILKRGLPE
ncbi:MAG: 50S ribosomal protein L11 methyltransferase [Proteobacteria bacterium]|nr:50S ribosomal protein L11 methyltransferase [Pseudomonadota bacterium]